MWWFYKRYCRKRILIEYKTTFFVFIQEVHPLKLRNKKNSELDGYSDDDCDPFESCVRSECDRSDQF